MTLLNEIFRRSAINEILKNIEADGSVEKYITSLILSSRDHRDSVKQVIGKWLDSSDRDERVAGVLERVHRAL